MFALDNAINSNTVNLRDTSYVPETFVAEQRALVNTWLAQSNESPFAGVYLERQLAAASEWAQDDWDGEGAVAIGGAVIGNTRSIAHRLLTLGIGQPDVVPNTNGTLTLEWERQDLSAYLEIGATTFGFFCTGRSGGKSFASGNTRDFAQGYATYIQALLVATPILQNSAFNWVVALGNDVL